MSELIRVRAFSFTSRSSHATCRTSTLNGGSSCTRAAEEAAERIVRKASRLAPAQSSSPVSAALQKTKRSTRARDTTLRLLVYST